MRGSRFAAIAGLFLLLAGATLLVYAALHTSRPAAQAATQADILRTQLASLSTGAQAATARIPISSALMTRLMEEDVSANKPYLETVLRVRGADAGRAAEEAIRAPYRARIAEIQSNGSDSSFIDVQTVTVGDRLTFSAVSFDGYLRPKDPVSVVFFGSSTAGDIYGKLTAPDCSQGACLDARFKDQDGTPNAEGLKPCHSQTQWVLMGSMGSELQWRRSTFGVMGQDGGCASGTRDHARLFAELTDREYGTWLVATPHREEWTSRGHIVKSWQAPSEAFAEAWGATRSPTDAGTVRAGLDGSGWAVCNALNAGVYQDVPFDGRAVIISTAGTRGAGQAGN